MSFTGTITWWGAASVEVSINGHSVVIDPYLRPVEAKPEFILVTREDYDHCHEPTLERLAGLPSFERLFAPKSCTAMSRLDTPVLSGARDLAFINPDALTVMYPKYSRKRGRDYSTGTDYSDLTTEVTAGTFHIEGVESNDHEPVHVTGPQVWGKRFKRDESEVWPVGTGPYAAVGEFPALGYVITELETNVTLYHPGDLQAPFDSQRELRGRVDYMFLPLAAAEGAEVAIIDNVRPRYVIPIHYRLPDPSFPIPLEIGGESLATTDLSFGRPKEWADLSVYRREIHQMMAAHWYATPPDPLERIRRLTAQAESLGVSVLVLDAGTPYEIDVADSGESAAPVTRDDFRGETTHG